MSYTFGIKSAEVPRYTLAVHTCDTYYNDSFDNWRFRMTASITHFAHELSPRFVLIARVAVLDPEHMYADEDGFADRQIGRLVEETLTYAPDYDPYWAYANTYILYYKNDAKYMQMLNTLFPEFVLPTIPEIEFRVEVKDNTGNLIAVTHTKGRTYGEALENLKDSIPPQNDEKRNVFFYRQTLLPWEKDAVLSIGK